MSNKIIAIHQPNYLGWLGYFHKIIYSDVFVFLDNVLFSNSDMVRRTKIRKGVGVDDVMYLAVPLVKHGRQEMLIKNVGVSGCSNWTEQHLNKIKHFYKKAEYFDEILPLVVDIIEGCVEFDLLADVNIYCTKRILGALGVERELHRASDLPVGGERVEHTLNTIKHFGCNVYISGMGAREFQSDGDFKSCGIKLVYQDIYNYLDRNPYIQTQTNFINGLSIIDILFNISTVGALGIINEYTGVLGEGNV